MMYRRARGLPASDTGTSTSLMPNDPGGAGAAEELDEVAALATGLTMLKIPMASANIVKLIERRTFSPSSSIRAAPQPCPLGLGGLGHGLGKLHAIGTDDRTDGNRDREERVPRAGVVAGAGG